MIRKTFMENVGCDQWPYAWHSFPLQQNYSTPHKPRMAAKPRESESEVIRVRYRLSGYCFKHQSRRIHFYPPHSYNFSFQFDYRPVFSGGPGHVQAVQNLCNFLGTPAIPQGYPIAG